MPCMKQAAILLAGAVAALAGCAGTAPQGTPDATLNALVEEYFERQLELSPMNATAIGDSRYDDRLDESTSPGFREKVFGIERAFLDRARRIDAAQLSPSSRITYEIFTTEREHALAGQKFHEEYMPLNQMAGLPMELAVSGSGTGPQPFKTADDYRRFLARMKQFPRWVDGAITQMRTGMSRGITLPKPAVAKIVPQLRGIVTATPEAGIFWGPVTDMPAVIPDAERERISRDYAAALRQEVLPAYTRLADFFEHHYLPAARTSVGWNDLPDGAAWYRWRIHGATTMDLPPDQIHELGLKEVARIRAEMLAVKEQVGFQGDLDAFFRHLEDDPQFYFTSEQELLDAYRDVKRRIDALLPKLFSDFPKADYEIRPVEAFRAASAAGGSTTFSPNPDDPPPPCEGEINEKGECVPPPPPPPPPPGTDGCTPGYWKANVKKGASEWALAGYSPAQLVGSVFAAGSFNSATLLEALEFGGGSGVSGATRILLRAAVAAVLNAASPGVGYPMSVASIVSDVNAAIATADRGAILALASSLDAANNLGCPLNNSN